MNEWMNVGVFSKTSHRRAVYELTTVAPIAAGHMSHALILAVYIH